MLNFKKVNTSSLVKDLCSITSPSGYEDEVRKYVYDLLEGVKGISIDTDILGNVYIKKPGTADKTIMLVAHCDEIGLTVKYIDDNGYIYFSPIGGIDTSLLKGQRVSIVHNNCSIKGVIGVQPIHLRRNIRNKSSDADLSDFWVDVGVSCQSKEKMELVSVGDPITFLSNYQDLQNNLFSSKSIDDRAGVAILLSVLHNVIETETLYNIVFVLSVQEELGLRGARIAGYRINPDICIAVDATHATDYPTVDKKKNGDIRLNCGCVIPIGANFNMELHNQLRIIAKQKSIAVQIESIPCNSGTDIADIQLSRNGVKTALVSIPCRYMHSPVEIASYADIQAAVNILSALCSNSVAK